MCIHCFATCQILKTLRRNLTKPITCKFRLLDRIEDTVEFARMCEAAGAQAIGIHTRYIDIILKANDDPLYDMHECGIHNFQNKSQNY